MDWQSRLSACPFKAGLIVEIVDGWTFFWCWKLREERVMIEQRVNDLEVVGHVGPHVEHAVRLQDASDSIGKEVGKKSASAMLPLPPRVGKVDVNRRQRRGPDQVVEQIIRIAADHASVRLLTFEEPLRSAPAFREIEFDAEEISLWLSRAGVEEEHAASAADVQLNRVRVAEELLPIQAAAHREVRGEVIEAEKAGTKIDNFRHWDQLGSPGAAPRLIGTPIIPPSKTSLPSTKP